MLTQSDYMFLLPGLDESYPGVFLYLARLLGQDQFEMLENDPEKIDRRVIYLMNDTAESYLVLKDCTYTGEYDPEYEGEIQPRITRNENGYVLILQMEDQVMTLFFTDLTLQVQLYDYGDVGHFWMKGYEYLRNIEYQIAIISDKYEYLGEGYCTEEEKKIAALRDFPPLNYMCYPAAPARYVVGKDDPWNVSEEAAAYVQCMAAQMHDTVLQNMVQLYKMYPVKRIARWLGYLLHRKKHFAVIRELGKRIREEGSHYPKRHYNSGIEKNRKALMKNAQNVLLHWQNKGVEGRIIREEPFVLADDGTDFSVYVMLYRKKLGNIQSQVIQIDVS